jgi:carboxymethylenebutenolidase
MAPNENWATLQVNGEEMRAFVTLPDGADAVTPVGAVVVIQHAGGVDQFIQDMTRRTIAAGIAGIAPDLYHRLDPNSQMPPMARLSMLDDDQVVADVNAAVAYLQGLPGVDSNRIGITGFCMGGRVAYLMPALRPEVFKAAMPFYGGNTMDNWGGDPDSTTPFQRLSQLRCPVLSFFGGEDQNPSPEHAEMIDTELQKAGVPHEHHSYAGAGHAYMDHTNPQRYNEAGAQASWPIALDFLKRHLG